MKKLLILTFTLLLLANHTFAQTDGPSKKETFDFILLMLNKGIEGQSVNNYDYSNYYLSYTTNRNLVQFRYSLEDVTSIISVDDYGVKYGRGIEIKLRLKKNAKQYLPQSDGRIVPAPKPEINQVYFYAKNSTDSSKLLKALNHWIKINKVDESLFDD